MVFQRALIRLVILQLETVALGPRLTWQAHRMGLVPTKPYQQPVGSTAPVPYANNIHP